MRTIAQGEPGARRGEGTRAPAAAEDYIFAGDYNSREEASLYTAGGGSANLCGHIKKPKNRSMKIVF